jgi:hypothetical protein
MPDASFNFSSLLRTADPGFRVNSLRDNRLHRRRPSIFVNMMPAVEVSLKRSRFFVKEISRDAGHVTPFGTFRPRLFSALAAVKRAWTLLRTPRRVAFRDQRAQS